MLSKYQAFIFISGFLFLFSNLTLAIDPRYHTYGEVIDEMRLIWLNHQEITKIYTIGYTTGFNLPILAMKISDNPEIDEDEPAILFNGIHHAPEVIGPEICLYLMADLVAKYGNDSLITEIINSSEIWVLPMVNPDGNYIVHAGFDTLWRKNCRDNNQNGIWDFGDGVDLNRNYDFLWSMGGTLTPSDRNYRGPYPFSENETQAIRDLALREKFVFDICYHSSKEAWEGEAVYYPWRWGNPFAPDHNHIRPIAESIALSIVNDAGTGTYYATYGRATEGGLTRNWLYYAIGTFAFTIEVSHGYFPPGYRVDSICQRNLPGAYYLLRRMHGSQITGHITDSITGEPMVAEVRILQAYAPPETIAPRTSDPTFGRYFRILSPGNYTVQVIKPGYDTVTIPNVNVTFGQPTVLDIKMQPGRAMEKKNQVLNVSYDDCQVASTIGTNFANIVISLKKQSDVTIKIYTSDGRLIKDFATHSYQPGKHILWWHFDDQNGHKVNNGIYFIKIITPSFEKIKKIVLID
ncbi:MAG: M14 family zinc carboxypeptidase [candidate division WOR-3 bacterium]